jgi:quercetin dioxygenase-like cupin family protein
MKKLLIFAAVIAVVGSAWAQQAIKVTTVTPDALTWKDNPNIPKGAQVAILLGDPTRAGDVVVQGVKLPPNYQVPPHTHPDADTVTVISGSVGLGMGETVEKGELAKPGTF